MSINWPKMILVLALSAVSFGMAWLKIDNVAIAAVLMAIVTAVNGLNDSPIRHQRSTDKDPPHDPTP